MLIGWPVFRLYPTNKEWDRLLSRALSEGAVSFVDDRGFWGVRCFLDTTEVWIHNWPYAYGAPAGFVSLLPSRSVARRLRRLELEFRAGQRQEAIQEFMSKTGGAGGVDRGSAGPK